jgi:hypothetical protein
MKNPYEMPYDDTVCAGCGATLTEHSQPATWPFHGFCHAGCAAAAAGSYHLLDAPAVEMAERSSTRGGPGFERDLVRDWLKAATANAPAMLTRSSAEADTVGGSPTSWCWRLYSGGQCRAMRLTKKEN